MPPKSAEYTGETNFYEVNCPSGSFVTGFTVTEDSSIQLSHNANKDSEHDDTLITSLWPLQCSNGDSVGSDSQLRALSKSRSFDNRRANGYSGITLFTGELVDAVALQPAGTRYGGRGAGSLVTRALSCPVGKVITGIYGQATEDHVISVGLSCRST